ncbi:hypothetical protein CIB48_g11962 [Xylaria polymorpha]|nr:hypothetical protein CIB48_g11962 [Xylaria polymorpha]
MASNMPPPAGIASPANVQQFANENAESAHGLVYRSEGAMARLEMMAGDTDNEQLSNKIKLDALNKKTEELQGYVNQLQDAVTISMFQLRDLKKRKVINVGSVIFAVSYMHTVEAMTSHKTPETPCTTYTENADLYRSTPESFVLPLVSLQDNSALLCALFPSVKYFVLLPINGYYDMSSAYSHLAYERLESIVLTMGTVINYQVPETLHKATTGSCEKSTESHRPLLVNTDPAIALATLVQMRPDNMSHQYQHSHQSTQPADNQSQNTATYTKIPRKPLDPDVAAQQMSPQPKLRTGSTRGSGWAWEYAALALSAIAVTALVILLAYIDNLRLSHWTLSISSTTAISILAAIARASLGFAISSCLGQAKWNWFRKRSDTVLAFDRFDDASRGPWGSFWLIVWVRAYHSVAIGAAVTIVLLAFEPFFQAILSFDGSIASSEPALAARIGRSEVFDAGTYFTYHDPIATMILPSNETIVLDGYISRPDLGMVSALNSGFYNISGVKTQTASFTCPTANCTWSPFTTLAICSACNIVTDHLKREKKEGQSLGGLRDHVADLYTNWTINSLPDVNLTNISSEKAVLGNNNILQSQLLTATRLTNPQHTISFKNLTNMITTVQILKAAEGYIKGDAIWDDTSVTATECALYFCTNAYNSSVKQGELHEKIIASRSERDPTSYVGLNSSPSAPTAAFDKWNNYSLYSGDYDVDRTNLELLIPPGDTRRFDLPENATTRFSLTQTAVGSTGRFLNTEFFSDWMTCSVHHKPSNT